MNHAYLDLPLSQLQQLREILVALGEALQILDDSHALFLERYDELLRELPLDPVSSQYLGQELLCQIIQRYPQIAHLIPRDLLWFFGGDCLHFMPDEEIALYQELEEQRYTAEQRGETFDWLKARQLLQTTGSEH